MQGVDRREALRGICINECNPRNRESHMTGTAQATVALLVLTASRLMHTP